MPPIIGQLMSFLDKTEPPPKGRTLLERYGLTPTTVDEFVKHAFQPGSSAGGH
jgi:hypothetical protein